MKINNLFFKKITNLKQKTTSLLGNIKMRLGLKKDVFQKTGKNINGNNVVHKGDKFTHIPDSINIEGNVDGFSVDKITFFKKDVEKMKQMTDEECIKYKQYLIEKNRYKM